MIEVEEGSSEYREWNSKIASYFFNEEMKQRPINLAVDEAVLKEIGGDPVDLVLAVLEEKERNNCASLVHFARFLQKNWGNREGSDLTPFPPFVALLSVLVLAVNHEGDRWPAHNYFDRLESLLGALEERLNSLEAFIPLWVGLEKWSREEMNGQIGIFRVQFFGKQKGVGLPRRQILISRREHDAIFNSFLTSGLTPEKEVSDRQLFNILKRGADGLLTRSKNLLLSWPSEEAACFISEVRNLLETWDMESTLDSRTDIDHLRLPLLLQLVFQKTKLTSAQFVSEVVSGLTDEDSWLSSMDNFKTVSEPLVLDTESLSSGKAIVVDKDRTPFWPLATSPFTELTLQSESRRFVLYRPAKTSLVFHQVKPGILEEIKKEELRPNGNYLLLSMSRSETVPEFAIGFKTDLQVCPLWEGTYYRAFTASTTTASSEIGTTRITVVGGLPSEKGRRSFLHFAPPVIAVGSSSSDVINPEITGWSSDARGLPIRLSEIEKPYDTSDSESLIQHDSARYFEITGLTERCVKCEVLVVNNDERSARTIFFDKLPLDFEWRTPAGRDGYGVKNADDATFIGTETIRSNECRLPNLTDFKTLRHITVPTTFPEDVSAQRLMQLMFVRRHLPWMEAKRILRGCIGQYGGTRINLSYEVRCLHVLGILEIEESEFGHFESLVSLPPKISLLPRQATRDTDWFSFQCILLGCWPSELLAGLRKEAKKAGVEVVEYECREDLLLVPNKRLLLATGPNAMEYFQTMADALGVEFDRDVPVATKMAGSSVSLTNFLTDSTWEYGSSTNTYQQHFFDPYTLTLTTTPPENDTRYQLVECRDPKIPIWTYFIVDKKNDKRLRVVDRQLARWLIRKISVPNTALPIVLDTGLFVPIELQLPLHLERIIVLSTGVLPARIRLEKNNSPVVEREFEGSPSHHDGKHVGCGQYYCYRGAYRTQLWPTGSNIPVLDLPAKKISSLGVDLAYE